jgi:CRISPR-associated protein Cas2
MKRVKRPISGVVSDCKFRSCLMQSVVRNYIPPFFSTADAMLYLISYDIPDTPRRTKVAKTLLDYGNRVQFSVFECILEDKALFEKMCRRLDHLIHVEEDNLRIYGICAFCREAILIKGASRVIENPNVYIL